VFDFQALERVLTVIEGIIMRILVVDDTKMERWLLEKLLLGLGHEVVAVTDGAEAVEAFKKKPFPMVMLDWMMPKMDGIEACRQIRAMGSEIADYTYIVMVTSKNEKENYIEALQAGADDFIHKPIDKTDLSVKVKAGERILDFNSKIADKNKDLEILQKELVEHNVKLMKQVEGLKKNVCATTPEASLTTPYDALRFGEMHLVECPDTNKERAFVMFLEDVTHDIPGLVITRENPDKVKEKYKLVNTEVVWLTKGLSMEKEGAYIPLNILAVEEDPDQKEDLNKNLQVILDLVREFLASKGKCVVMLDGIEYLFTRFSPASTMDMLYDMNDLVKKGDGKAIVAYYPDTIDATTFSILKKEMNWVPVKK
jgi:CheY-like chemotaxis protein